MKNRIYDIDTTGSSDASIDLHSIQQQLQEIQRTLETEKWQILFIQSSIAIIVVLITGYFTLRQVKKATSSGALIKWRDDVRSKVADFIGEYSATVWMFETSKKFISSEKNPNFKIPDLLADMVTSRHRLIKFKGEIELLLENGKESHNALMNLIDEAMKDLGRLSTQTVAQVDDIGWSKRIIDCARTAINEAWNEANS